MAKESQASTRIEEMRKAKGMTLEQLAEQSGFSAPYVWQMAHGVRNVSLKNLTRLAAALDCRPEDLLSTPTATNSEILNIWAAIPAERREAALTMLRSLTNPNNDSGPPAHNVKKMGGKPRR